MRSFFWMVSCFGPYRVTFEDFIRCSTLASRIEFNFAKCLNLIGKLNVLHLRNCWSSLGYLAEIVFYKITVWMVLCFGLCWVTNQINNLLAFSEIEILDFFKLIKSRIHSKFMLSKYRPVMVVHLLCWRFLNLIKLIGFVYIIVLYFFYALYMF